MINFNLVNPYVFIFMSVLCVVLLGVLVLLFRTNMQLKNKVSTIRSIGGLLNRQDFFYKLIDLVKVRESNPEKRIALLIIDMDNFKNMNDSLGPIRADSLLENIARRLKITNIKHKGMLAHLNADEFGLVLDKCSKGTKEIGNIANDLLNIISKPYNILEEEVLITASIGICVFPDGATNAGSLLNNAVTAKYNAKKLGKNTFSFFTEDMSNKVLYKMSLTRDLHKALDNEELFLCYQPQVCAKTGIVIGGEALIRWRHSTRGIIPPVVFVPLAEESGLINPIGDWIIKTACSNIYQLHKNGFPDLKVGVNLSAFQFNQGDVAGTIARMIWEVGIDPKKVDLELTESMVMGNADKSALMLMVLKSMGVTLAVDDFGTGYSSLSHLRTFPIDTLKIDQSFVKNMHEDEESRTIVLMIISLAKQLNLYTIAEGVENKQAVDILVANGCDYLQGYYYSKPLEYDKFCAFVRKNAK